MTSATAEIISQSFIETPAAKNEEAKKTQFFKNTEGSKSFIKKPTQGETKPKPATARPKGKITSEDVLLTEASDSSVSVKKQHTRVNTMVSQKSQDPSKASKQIDSIASSTYKQNQKSGLSSKSSAPPVNTVKKTNTNLKNSTLSLKDSKLTTQKSKDIV